VVVTKENKRMGELSEAGVKALAEAAGISVPVKELSRLTIRFNGFLGLGRMLEELPLGEAEPTPTIQGQQGGR
jgi:hypothetical protein